MYSLTLTPLTGYYDKWVLPVLGCNEATLYRNRPVGNSPELMPLDASLNKDFKDCIMRHVICTLKLHSRDEKKFDISTPTRISSVVRRIITRAFPSARIKQDCIRVLDSLARIVKAKGTVVPGCGQRPGKNTMSFLK